MEACLKLQDDRTKKVPLIKYLNEELEVIKRKIKNKDARDDLDIAEGYIKKIPASLIDERFLFLNDPFFSSSNESSIIYAPDNNSIHNFKLFDSSTNEEYLFCGYPFKVEGYTRNDQLKEGGVWRTIGDEELWKVNSKIEKRREITVLEKEEED